MNLTDEIDRPNLIAYFIIAWTLYQRPNWTAQWKEEYLTFGRVLPEDQTPGLILIKFYFLEEVNSGYQYDRTFSFLCISRPTAYAVVIFMEKDGWKVPIDGQAGYWQKSRDDVLLRWGLAA